MSTSSTISASGVSVILFAGDDGGDKSIGRAGGMSILPAMLCGVCHRVPAPTPVARRDRNETHKIYAQIGLYRIFRALRNTSRRAWGSPVRSKARAATLASTSLVSVNTQYSSSGSKMRSVRNPSSSKSMLPSSPLVSSSSSSSPMSVAHAFESKLKFGIVTSAVASIGTLMVTSGTCLSLWASTPAKTRRLSWYPPQTAKNLTKKSSMSSAFFSLPVKSSLETCLGIAQTQVSVYAFSVTSYSAPTASTVTSD